MDDGNDCTGREECTQMSAFDELFNKKHSQANPIEKCILFQWTRNEQLAEQAAADLAAKDAELAFFRGAFRSAAKNYADMIERQKA